MNSFWFLLVLFQELRIWWMTQSWTLGKDRIASGAREAIDTSNQDVLQAAIVRSVSTESQKFAPSVSDDTGQAFLPSRLSPRTV